MEKDVLEEEFEFPALLIFFSLSYNYMQFVRVFPDENPISSCYVCSDDGETSALLPFRPIHYILDNQISNQENLASIVTYIYNKENKQQIKKIQDKEILYRRVIDLINNLVQSEKIDVIAKPAKQFIIDSVNSLISQELSYQDEIVPLDVVYHLFDYLEKNGDSLITMSELQEFLLSAVEESQFYFDINELTDNNENDDNPNKNPEK